MLDDINLELLRTFDVAARHPTFRATARARHVTVSAISQQMRALEAQLKIALFERVGRGLKLTAAGRSLARALEAQLADLDATLTRVVGASGEVGGPVRIGGPRAFTEHHLLPRFTELMRTAPALRLVLSFNVPSVLERQLADGAIDLAILVRPSAIAGVVTHPIAVEHFICVAAPSLLSRLPRDRSVAALNKWPWMIFDGDMAMLAPWWRAAFGRKSHFTSAPTAEVPSLEHLRALAIAGAGVTVLPAYFVETAIAERKLARVEIASARKASNIVYLAWRADSPDTATMLEVRRAIDAGAL